MLTLSQNNYSYLMSGSFICINILKLVKNISKYRLKIDCDLCQIHLKYRKSLAFNGTLLLGNKQTCLPSRSSLTTEVKPWTHDYLSVKSFFFRTMERQIDGQNETELSGTSTFSSDVLRNSWKKDSICCKMIKNYFALSSDC